MDDTTQAPERTVTRTIGSIIAGFIWWTIAICFALYMLKAALAVIFG